MKIRLKDLQFHELNGLAFFALVVLALSLTGCTFTEWKQENTSFVTKVEEIAEHAATAAEKSVIQDLKNLDSSSQGQE